MSPVGENPVGVRGPCLDPIGEKKEAYEETKGALLVEEHQWEGSAPRPGTQPSGLFNMDMDLTSGLSAAESEFDGTKLFVDPAVTSTVDFSELFPDLTDLLIPTTPEEEATSPLNVGDEVYDAAAVTSVAGMVKEEHTRRGQLPSTSSYSASGSEMSDYEEGLSPAEVDVTLEKFFNTFTDLNELLEVTAGTAGPTATIDSAAVRNLIDDPTTTDDKSSLVNLLTVDGSLTLTTANATQHVKCEDFDEEEEREEETCPVAKKSRTAESHASQASMERDPKHRQRRVKNNLACKRARQNRKKRESNLVTTAKNLEEENALLRAKIEELSHIAEMSRAALVNVLVK